MHVICRFFRFQGVIVEIFALKQLMPFKNKPSALRDYHFFLFGIRLFDDRFFSESPKGSSDLDGFIWRPGIHAAMTKPISMDWENSGLINWILHGWINKNSFFFIKKQKLKWDFETALPIIFSIFSCLWVEPPVRYVCPTRGELNEVTLETHLPSTCKGLSPTWNRTHRHVWKPILVGGGQV